MSPYNHLTEELVTMKLAKYLAQNGHEIISVHPPDGQGPFVIPKPSVTDSIERSSYHPDIVSLGTNVKGDKTLYISECKIYENDLLSDRRKLEEFASNDESILYAFFRCQIFENGPALGFDFDFISSLSRYEYPLHFILCATTSLQTTISNDSDIGGYSTSKYLFNKFSLLT